MLAQHTAPAAPAWPILCERWGALLFLLVLASGCSSTQVRQVRDAGGEPLAVNGSVVLIEPDIELYEVLAGGAQEPRQAWSEAARELLPTMARQVLESRGLEVRSVLRLPEDAGPDDPRRQMALLSEAVSISILTYAQTGSRLKTKHGKFDWTLGPGVTVLQNETSADYGLFTYIRDSYSSGGRVAMRIIGALLLGGDVGGGVQIGVASLVDLRTGQVIWHNRLIDQTGDLRTPQGARETAGQLLRGLGE